mmetsp:Transcript_18228/g.21042  ORF Transcript_18228/g.21042 Transcript_18228/m.21042 type:complete len:98 (-) Transcript_18228:126-419(-)
MISTILRRPRYFISKSNTMEKITSRRFSTTPKSGGSNILQRLSSFVIGAGVTALASQYYIFDEIRAGNQLMLSKHKEIEQRLAKVEKEVNQKNGKKK